MLFLLLLWGVVKGQYVQTQLSSDSGNQFQFQTTAVSPWQILWLNNTEAHILLLNVTHDIEVQPRLMLIDSVQSGLSADGVMTCTVLKQTVLDWMGTQPAGTRLRVHLPVQLHQGFTVADETTVTTFDCEQHACGISSAASATVWIVLSVVFVLLLVLLVALACRAGKE